MARRIAALAGLGLLACALGCARGETSPGIAPATLAARIEAGSAPKILDVRSPAEFASGHVPGAINVPHTELATRLPALDLSTDDEIVVYCERGPRASSAAATLRGAGFVSVEHLEGDMSAWRDEQRPCEGC